MALVQLAVRVASVAPAVGVVLPVDPSVCVAAFFAPAVFDVVATVVVAVPSAVAASVSIVCGAVAAGVVVLAVDRSRVAFARCCLKM